MSVLCYHNLRRNKMFEQATNDTSLNNFPVHHACREGDVQALAKFVGLREDKNHLLAEDNLYHWTPIHWASFFGQLPALIMLREAGVGVDTITARFKQTAAHIAAFAGSDHCLKYLVHFGCNVNVQDYLGETPLHKVARTGSVECARVLADGRALPDVPNNSGQTPAVLAATCGHQQMAVQLTEYVQFVSQQNVIRESALGPTVCAAQPQLPVCQPGLNGGLLPARGTPASGHWCYQPPRHQNNTVTNTSANAAAWSESDMDAIDTDGLDSFGSHQQGGAGHHGNDDPSIRLQGNDLLGVNHQGNGADAGNGLLAGVHSSSDRKRPRDEVVFEDFKRRRLAELEGPRMFAGLDDLGLSGPPGLCGLAERQSP